MGGHGTTVGGAIVDSGRFPWKVHARRFPMFTVCPNCALTLVVTAEHLRSAQGYVRCGHCSSVFNALARLTDERPAPEVTGEADPAATAELSIEPEPKSQAQSAQPLLSPGQSSLAPELRSAASLAAAADGGAIPEDALEFNAATTDAGAAWGETPPYVWRIGTALAVLVLSAQIVNHYRDQLAASARFGPPLTALYAALGVQLTPQWDLRAYEVRQLGASVDRAGAGLITIRASIKNSARQPQPLPWLRVTLQDRFGNPIAARDVAPRFYLPPATPTSSFLSAGQRVDAEMGFVDPGTNAVGFEIDACLPASGGGVACANNLGAR